jgi:hypothetical protein
VIINHGLSERIYKTLKEWAKWNRRKTLKPELWKMGVKNDVIAANKNIINMMRIVYTPINYAYNRRGLESS